MAPSIFGTSLRRLKIYYINNARSSKCVGLLFVVLVVYLFFGTSLFGRKKSLGIVRYKDVEDDIHMSDSNIQSHLEVLEDTRPMRCRDGGYDFTRLDVSETISIILHYNEDEFYNLKLTLSSIVDHTPYDLYEEILVLDDGSADKKLRKHVSNFLQEPKFSKVKVYRSETFDGVSSSRLKASLVAKGSILIFVSSAVVVNHGWIQPLIAKVSTADNLVAVPHYDNLLSDHRFYRTDDQLVNTFAWSLYTVYIESPEKDEEMLTTSVMRGDVFAVKKSFLSGIGNYDEHFKANGGGEHIELSFRIWLCGGEIKVVTCSRVAVHNSLKPQSVTSASNYRRVAELWMEDHSETAYHQGDVSPKLTEDESQSLVMRKNYFKQLNMKCKDFNWYINNIATEVFPPSDKMVHFGKIKVKTNYCIRMISESDVDMALCRQYMYDRSMMFEMNEDGAIFKGDHCLTIEQEDDSTSERLILSACSEGNELQTWKLKNSKLKLKSRAGKCLSQVSERDETTLELFHSAYLKDCSVKDERMQTWEFISY